MQPSIDPKSSLVARLGGGKVLMVVAAGIEVEAIRRGLMGAGGGERVASGRGWRSESVHPGIELVECGIGKANAAGATGVVADPSRHGLIVSVGIAGALGDEGSMAAMGQMVVATESWFADDGVATPTGFSSCPEMGFAFVPGMPTGAMPVDAGWLKVIRGMVDLAGPIATVSTCSGTDELASAVVKRTGAIAEGMEGAAVGLVALRLGVAFAEVRAISNTTGDRGRQRWDVGGALARLTAWSRAFGGVVEDLR